MAPKIGDIVETRVWFNPAEHPFFPGKVIPLHEEVRIAKVVSVTETEIIGEVSDGKVSFTKDQIIKIFNDGNTL